MDQNTKETLDKLVNSQSLSEVDLKKIREILVDKSYKQELMKWLTDSWNSYNGEDIDIDYGGLRKKISEYEAEKGKKNKIRNFTANFVQNYQKIAAVFFFPLMLGAMLYIFMNRTEPSFFTAEAPLGQKAKIQLPDGSTVWLNSGSSIKYSSEFNKKNRILELTGEAFFDVQKNTGKPFFVQTPYLNIKVTGTRFSVSAYGDEPLVETGLVEGAVYVTFPERDLKASKLTPGNMLVYSKRDNVATVHPLNEETVTGWMNNQLIFVNDDFPKLVKKIERWYNVEVVYNPDDFITNKLTVKLLEGEQLEELLTIIESVTGATCNINENKIYIKKKGEFQ